MTRNVPLSYSDFESMTKETGCRFPYDADLSRLSESVSVGRRTVPNRLVYQAMEGCDGTADGAPDELTRRRYLRFAKGGAGIIWYEATAVLPEGRANPRQLYIDEKTMGAHAELCREIKATCLRENGYEPIVIMQLTHSGRYSKPEGTPAPLIAYHSPIFEEKSPISDDRIVSDAYLDSVGEALVRGAKMAEEAGFDGADIKACHRYLLCELLSAYTRDGRYGGSFENRTRLLRESIHEAISSASADFIITSRMNVYDGFPYPYGFGVREGEGITPDFSEAKRLTGELAAYGVKLLDFTMGNPYFNPHVNRPFAKGGYEAAEHPLEGVQRMLDGIAEIRASLPSDVKVISSGISYLGAASAGVVSGYIRDGGFDFAGYGRETLAYPDVARDICKNRELNPKKLCIACSKCTQIMRQAGGTPGCVIRDAEVYMPIYRDKVIEHPGITHTV